MALKATAQGAAEAAIAAIGRGYDVVSDVRLKYCKGKLTDPDARLIDVSRDEVQDVLLPGGIKVTGVPKSIKCDKGERMRFRSDVLSFQEMSEQFNQELSLNGKIPSGMFNSMFEFSGCWQKDAANTKSLAFDAWYRSLYTVALPKSGILLRDHVTQAVPSTWDPAALARFIDKFGTHIVVGVKMGGKDVIYLKQQHSSSLQPAVVQKRLKDMSDSRFQDANGQYDMNNKDAYGKDKNDARDQRLRFVESSPSSSYCSKEDLVMVAKRRGGREWDKEMPHSDWINTVQLEPDVISMSFLPITSLLNGVPGCGFLNHAINLYLRYKPPIEELHQFLEFQLPRQWAPVYSDHPLGPQRRKQSSASLSLSFMGPRLYVCTNMVDVGERPVTGIRLYLEGKKSNMLAIHLEHLCSLPQTLQLQDDPYNNRAPEPYDRKYLEPFGSWKRFSHVYTAPVESDDDSLVVTGAQLHVSSDGLTQVLFLRLHFSKVSNAALVKNPEWEGSPNLDQKSGLISTLISMHFSTAAQKPAPRPADVNINSAGPPVLVRAPKLLKYVDITEMVRGPQDTPGYWIISGAKLQLERGKISLRVKYSLLTAMVPNYWDTKEEEAEAALTSAVQSHPNRPKVILTRFDRCVDDKIRPLSTFHGFRVAPEVMPLELLRQITNDFSKEQQLGRGTFGTVYKGVQSGKKIAIKLLHPTPRVDHYEEEFMKEFKNLRRLEHPNIVQLLGYCYEIKCVCIEYEGRSVLADKIYRALCFEYMQNGCLKRYLDAVDDKFNRLDWQTSYKIIKGTCKGLKYLHEESESPMYHLDLKPENILLDGNMVPKIADFGVSKLVCNNETQATSSTLGTPKYCPPEYIEHGYVSNKFDIFSLGVVMIEILAGSEGYRKAVETNSQEFINHVQDNWRKGLQETKGHQVKRCIDIALQCVRADRSQRPSIGEITSWLNETEIGQN